MTQVLPVALRGIMDEHVRETLFGLCKFFNVISRKLIGVNQLGRLQEEIVVILCELEVYFPPAFLGHYGASAGPCRGGHRPPRADVPPQHDGVRKDERIHRRICSQQVPSRWKHSQGLSGRRVHLFLHELSRHREPCRSSCQQEPWQARWICSPRGSSRTACRLRMSTRKH